MATVYLIQSLKDPSHRYVGITTDIQRRLEQHSAGEVRSTSPFRPWSVIALFSFADERRAIEFEKYLKSGSGRAFAQSRLWPTPGSPQGETRPP